MTSEQITKDTLLEHMLSAIWGDLVPMAYPSVTLSCASDANYQGTDFRLEITYAQRGGGLVLANLNLKVPQRELTSGCDPIKGIIGYFVASLIEQKGNLRGLLEQDPRIGWPMASDVLSLPFCPLFDTPASLQGEDPINLTCPFCEQPLSSLWVDCIWGGCNLGWVHAHCYELQTGGVPKPTAQRKDSNTVAAILNSLWTSNPDISKYFAKDP